MATETVLIVLGGLMLAVGILGGGFSIKELQVPKVGMTPRVIAFAVGIGLIGFGATRTDFQAPQETGLDPASSAAAAGRLPAEVPAGTIPPRSVEIPTNLAVYGAATQSATDYNGDARRAIDGITNGHFFNSTSVTHTANQPRSSWQVRLQRPAAISRIVLFNRTDCCANRLSNFRVSVLDGDKEVFGQNVDGIVGFEQEFHLPADTVGQTVRVQLKDLNREGNGILSLAEVQVFGVPR